MNSGKQPKPLSRLTRIAGFLLDAVELHPEWKEDDRVIVMISHDDDPEGEGGVAMTGYYDDEDPEGFGDRQAMADLLSHVEAFAKATGQHLQVMKIRMTDKDNDG